MLRACLALIAYAAAALSAGCYKHYRDVTNDPRYAPLVGRKCVLTQAAPLPEGQPHWLPELIKNDMPLPPQVPIDAGTVLRVSHIEYWERDLDGNGTVAFAVAENGPQVGRQVVIGDASVSDRFTNPIVSLGLSGEAGLWSDVGKWLVPLAPEDATFLKQFRSEPAPTTAR
jgi:hypothetical protein